MRLRFVVRFVLKRGPGFYGLYPPVLGVLSAGAELSVDPEADLLGTGHRVALDGHVEGRGEVECGGRLHVGAALVAVKVRGWVHT